MTNKLPPPTDGSWRHVIGTEEFPAEKDRYHLYVGLFCPFAHRVIITRQLKGLQSFLPMSIVKPYPKDPDGWRFPDSDDEYPGSTIDHLFHSKFLHEIYQKSDPKYKGRYSVPVLWDKKTQQIVNNESADIMRMLNTVFNEELPVHSKRRAIDLYPEDLRSQIDEMNKWLGPEFNIGVYKAGFADDQLTYEANAKVVFKALDKLEAILNKNDKHFLLGERMTEVDIKAYTTLVRFDTVYVQHFKLNVGTIRHNYPKLNRYLKHIYWRIPGFKETTDFRQIKESYTKSHPNINPKEITPLGPIPSVESWTEEDEAWKLVCPSSRGRLMRGFSDI
ncbi:MAG: hypothetical protein M1834_002516 [Cirrosporium novae-zelandiae]|nr:MAG: hypothetical protein M1834_002516 [Cirrosporium novae-zelandiae]